MRTSGSDGRVLFDAFINRYHRPSRIDVQDKVQLVFDLGANIGITMADFATRFPEARVIGVELDSDNAGLCRENVSQWASRCTVVEGAVWPEDGIVEYEIDERAQYAMSAHPLGTVASPSVRRAPAVSLNTLVARFATSGDVDFIKMDVEGAERELFTKATDWRSRVRCMKVELHGDYTADACVADLERLGFEARGNVERVPTVVAVRR
ncbi:MAG: hypothetical protein AUI36_31500 [Cyanobacteria bacterium 13_1_40CM_2_61_4]|nr:MAG: hypothetical protein AUI36_31500 [Cyanobacteria bacterium 13_1_40CM_2_61_4]